MRKKTLLPPSDQDLATAEITEESRKQRIIDELAEADRAERLALAGEPEARAHRIEVNRAGLNASAAFLHAQPLEAPKAKKPFALPTRKERSRESEADTPVAPADRELTSNQESAFKLMDLAFQKFARDFKSKPKEARINLALDLGRDTAVYLKTGIWKVADALDAINKLTGLNTRAKEDDAEGQDFDADLDELRATLRG